MYIFTLRLFYVFPINGNIFARVDLFYLFFFVILLVSLLFLFHSWSFVSPFFLGAMIFFIFDYPTLWFSVRYYMNVVITFTCRHAIEMLVKFLIVKRLINCHINYLFENRDFLGDNCIDQCIPRHIHPI